MTWKIRIQPPAVKQFEKLSKRTKKRIKEALSSLEAAGNPFNMSGVKALTGQLKGDYRLRAGDYRILFRGISAVP